MGTKDTISKSYLKENHVFADVINCFLYNGDPVVQKEQLKEMDASISELPEDLKLPKQVRQLQRDVLKTMTVKGDSEVNYAIVGIEMQTKQDYTMPVRIMVYDAMQYESQIQAIRKEHQEKKEYGASEEFLSGYHRVDHLKPVITLVLYLNPDAWTAPRELSEMYTESEEELLKYAGNYALNLIVPAEIPDEKIMRLQTNLREVLLIIKYSKNKDALKKLVEKNGERMRKMEKKAAMIVKEYTKWKFEEEKEDETVDVCQAVKEWAIEEQMIGEKRGREQGMQEGVQQGMQQGMQQAINDIALKMLEDGYEENVIIHIAGLSAEKIHKLSQQ